MSDFGDMASRVSDFRDELERQHQRATQEAVEEMQSSVRAEIRGNDSIARGTLVGDVREGPSPTDKLVARAVSVPGWAKYLEYGTGQRARRDTLPGHDSFDAPSPLPPLDPILTWVIAKNITSNEYDSKTELAEAICQTIGEEGTFPHPFLRPVWYSESRGYRNVIRVNHRGLRRALRRI